VRGGVKGKATDAAAKISEQAVEWRKEDEKRMMEWMRKKLKEAQKKQNAKPNERVEARQGAAEIEHWGRMTVPARREAAARREAEARREADKKEIKDLQTYSAKMEKITKMFHNDEDRKRIERIRKGWPEYSTIKEE
jgi:hypothetical protein